MAGSVIAILGKFISRTFGFDYIGYEKENDLIVYKFKTSIVSKNLAEAKSKILSILNFPPDIPVDIDIEIIKERPLFKDAIVRVKVKDSGIAPLVDLLAKKYGRIRSRKYKR